MAVAIVSAIIYSWPPFQRKSRLLIGLNYILLYLNNSKQIAKSRIRSSQQKETAESMQLVKVSPSTVE